MSLTAKDIQQKIIELTAEDSMFALTDIELDGKSYRGFTHAAPDLVQMLQFGRGHADKSFIAYEGQQLSYTQFFEKADRLAAHLQQAYKLKPGDRFAIAMRNCPEWAIAFAAGVLCGAIAVPLNSWGKTDELMYGIEDCGASVVFCDPQRFALIEDQLDKLSCSLVVIQPGGGPVDSITGKPGDKLCAMQTLLDSVPENELEVANIAPDDLAIIMYTSGSTGYPKGAMHRQAAIPQAIMAMGFLGMLTMSLEGERPLRGGAEQETPLLTVPLFHGTGLVSGLLMPLLFGHKVVMMYKWDTDKALQVIQDEKVTGISSVPAVLQALFSHPDYDKFDTGSLMRVAIGGAATPEGLAELIASKIDGASRSTGWGMTETMALGATMSGAIYDIKPYSAGIRSPLVEMRCVDADGVVQQPNGIGELQVRGIVVCTGYWNHPEASAEIFDGEWLKSGDLACIDDDGYLHITGRIKEIVIRGGENIYPGEIENAAYAHDAVQEVVVFGVPDPVMGEELAMIAYARASENLNEETLRAHLKDRLAGFKVPKYIELRDQPLPQNITGKLFKRQMREDFIKQL